MRDRHANVVLKHADQRLPELVALGLVHWREARLAVFPPGMEPLDIELIQDGTPCRLERCPRVGISDAATNRLLIFAAIVKIRFEHHVIMSLLDSASQRPDLGEVDARLRQSSLRTSLAARYTLEMPDACDEALRGVRGPCDPPLVPPGGVRTPDAAAGF